MSDIKRLQDACDWLRDEFICQLDDGTYAMPDTPSRHWDTIYEAKAEIERLTAAVKVAQGSRKNAEAEIERQRAEIERLTAENEKLRKPRDFVKECNSLLAAKDKKIEGLQDACEALGRQKIEIERLQEALRDSRDETDAARKGVR